MASLEVETKAALIDHDHQNSYVGFFNFKHLLYLGMWKFSNIEVNQVRYVLKLHDNY